MKSIYISEKVDWNYKLQKLNDENKAYNKKYIYKNRSYVKLVKLEESHDSLWRVGQFLKAIASSLFAMTIIPLFFNDYRKFIKHSWREGLKGREIIKIYAWDKLKIKPLKSHKFENPIELSSQSDPLKPNQPINLSTKKIDSLEKNQPTANPINEDLISKDSSLKDSSLSVQNHTDKSNAETTSVNQVKQIQPLLLTSSVKEGLPLDNLLPGEGRQLMQMVNGWVFANETNAKKSFWTQEELANSLLLSKEMITEFCYRLQILQKNIPTELLDYYFGAIQEYILELNKKQAPFFSGKFTKECFEGNCSILALGRLRFPGRKIKNEWLLEELAMYLSIESKFLKDLLTENNVMPNREGFYSSSSISSNLWQKFEDNQASRTQKRSIRHIGYGAQTKPKNVGFSVSLYNKEGKTYELIELNKENF